MNINNKVFIVFLSGIQIKIYNIEGDNEELVLIESKNLQFGEK